MNAILSLSRHYHYLRSLIIGSSLSHFDAGYAFDAYVTTSTPVDATTTIYAIARAIHFITTAEAFFHLHAARLRQVITIVLFRDTLSRWKMLPLLLLFEFICFPYRLAPPRRPLLIIIAMPLSSIANTTRCPR